MSELIPAPRRKEVTPPLASEARHGLDYFELIRKTKDCGYALSVSSSELEVREERVRLGLSAYRAGIVSAEAKTRLSEEHQQILSQCCESFSAWMVDLLVSSTTRLEEETLWRLAITDIAKRLRGDAFLDEQIISSLILIAELQIPRGR